MCAHLGGSAKGNIPRPAQRAPTPAISSPSTPSTGMVERNAGLPAERRIEFRIGIHLGDVVEEADGDLMGDGVNIAARLEGVAKSGAICLSEGPEADWFNRPGEE